MAEKLIIEIPRPIGKDSKPTDRWDWHQGAYEAALGGLRAYSAGAELLFQPTISVEESDA